MICKLSDVIATWLAKTGTIEESEQELYSYAVYSFLFSLAPIVLSITVGMIMDMIIESLLFVLPFVAIRKFSGGFHLKSPTICFFSSVSTFIICFFVIKAIITYQVYLPIIIATILAVIQLMVVSPIDSENRKLSPKEFYVFRKITIIISILFALIFLLLSCIGLEKYACPIGVGIIMTSALQMPVIIKRHMRL